MMRKGLKEIGILEDEGSSTYHRLNPTSIGSSMPPCDIHCHSIFVLFILWQMAGMKTYGPIGMSSFQCLIHSIPYALVS